MAGRLACELVIICDEIYRDLVYDPAAPILSPAEVAPERTVITTGASKNLALGGWRIRVARMPAGRLGDRLRRALLGADSEICLAREVLTASVTMEAAPRAELVFPPRRRVPTITGAASGVLIVAASTFRPRTSRPLA